MPTESSFVTSAFYGIITAMLFAFIILMIATFNIIQSLLSILCVSTIIVSVLAIMKLFGWQMGISESISIVLLIGLQTPQTQLLQLLLNSVPPLIL